MRRHDPLRNPRIQDPSCPPSVAYTNGANPGDAEAVVGRNPFRHLYNRKCPHCGGPAHLAEFTLSTYENPEPKAVRQLLCYTRTDIRRRKDGPAPCPVVELDAEAVVDEEHASNLPSLKPTRRRTE